MVRAGGRVGIAPWDVGRYTPREIRERLTDQAKRERTRESSAWARAAWQLTYLMQPHMKQGESLALDDLLTEECLVEAGLKTEKDSKEERPGIPAQDRREMFESITRKFE